MGIRAGILCRVTLFVTVIISLSEFCQALEKPKNGVELPARDVLPQFVKLGKGASKPSSTPQPKKKNKKEEEDAEATDDDQYEDDLPTKPKPRCHFGGMYLPYYGDYGGYGSSGYVDYDYTESRRRRRNKKRRKRRRQQGYHRHVFSSALGNGH